MNKEQILELIRIKEAEHPGDVQRHFILEQSGERQGKESFTNT